MSRLKFVLPAAILAFGIGSLTSNLNAKVEYVKETKKACGFCHVDSKKDPKKLTPAGEYFKAHKSLDGFSEAK